MMLYVHLAVGTFLSPLTLPTAGNCYLCLLPLNGAVAYSSSYFAWQTLHWRGHNVLNDKSKLPPAKHRCKVIFSDNPHVSSYKDPLTNNKSRTGIDQSLQMGHIMPKDINYFAPDAFFLYKIPSI